MSAPPLQIYPEAKKVLFVAPMPPPVTGQSVACSVLYAGLVDKGYRVTLIDLCKQSFHQGITSVARMYEIASVLRSVIQHRHCADIVYFTPSQSIAGNLKDLVILWCLGSLQRSTVLHLHGGAGMRVLLSDKHPVLRSLNRLFLKRIGAVIVLGERLKSIYDGIVPADKLHAVPNFAEDEYFTDEATVKAKFAHTVPLRVLFLSNLLPGKGHHELLKSLSLLPPDTKKLLQIDFAGGFESPEDKAAFEEKVRLTDGVRITVHGVVQGALKKELLSQAHLFCLPTYYPYEGQPISILEAYASGCAVMTTNHSGIFDIFTPGHNGFEVEVKSPQSIADKLLAATNNTAQLCDYGLNNLRAAQESYRSSKHVEAIKSIVDGLSLDSSTRLFKSSLRD